MWSDVLIIKSYRKPAEIYSEITWTGLKTWLTVVCYRLLRITIIYTTCMPWWCWWWGGKVVLRKKFALDLLSKQLLVSSVVYMVHIFLQAVLIMVCMDACAVLTVMCACLPFVNECRKWLNEPNVWEMTITTCMC